jgi:hypothetical protein
MLESMFYQVIPKRVENEREQQRGISVLLKLMME